jgi:hypothetical protein
MCSRRLGQQFLLPKVSLRVLSYSKNPSLILLTPLHLSTLAFRQTIQSPSQLTAAMRF